MNTVIALRSVSVNALIDQTKAAWDRADEKKADADDWYRRTGQLLVDLKTKVEMEQGHGHWLTTLKQMDRSPRRAQELMELAGGIKTVKEMRTRKSKSQAKTREKARHVARFSPEPEEPEEYADQPLEERWEYSLANLCGDIIAIAPYWRKHFAGWEQFDCPPHVRKLLKEATAALVSISATVTSTRR